MDRVIPSYDYDEDFEDLKYNSKGTRYFYIKSNIHFILLSDT